MPELLVSLNSRDCKDDYKSIFPLHAEDDKAVKTVLKSLRQKRGIGLVYASAILTILKPDEFGVVNKYVIQGLKGRKALPQNFKYTSEEKLIYIEKILLNQETTVRKIRRFRYNITVTSLHS